MSISKRRLKNGSTVYDVVEYTGFTLHGIRDRKSVTCTSYKDAKREQARLVALRDATRNRSGRITLSQYVEQWYRPLMGELAASSRDTYERELRLRILPALGGIDVRDVNRAMIQRMVDGCKTHAPAKKALGVLKTILNEAVGDGIIVMNPACARFAMPPSGRKRDNGIVIGSFSAMRPVLDAAEGWGDGTCEKLAVTGLLMGLRPEERYGLDWADVDFRAGMVRVRRAYTAVSAAEGGNVLKETKTKRSARDVPMPPEASRRLMRLSRDGNVVMSGPFLIGASGKRLTPSTACKRWRAFLRDHPDLPPVTVENMRHSFATSYLAGGGNVENLSRILGHSDINTTFSRYVRPQSDALAEEMARVASVM